MSSFDYQKEKKTQNLCEKYIFLNVV